MPGVAEGLPRPVAAAGRRRPSYTTTNVHHLGTSTGHGPIQPTWVYGDIKRIFPRSTCLRAFHRLDSPYSTFLRRAGPNPGQGAIYASASHPERISFPELPLPNAPEQSQNSFGGEYLVLSHRRAMASRRGRPVAGGRGQGPMFTLVTPNSKNRTSNRYARLSDRVHPVKKPIPMKRVLVCVTWRHLSLVAVLDSVTTGCRRATVNTN